MQAVRAANLALAFLLELAMLAALGYAGWALTDVWWLRILLLIGLPAVAVVLWAVWAAPRSARRLSGPALLLFKAAVFAATTVLLWMAGQPLAAGVFGGLAALHLALAMLLKQS